MTKNSGAELAPESRDGRVRRGEANRGRILEALYALVGEGSVQPTAEQVARRAGVGERTVFRHFEDMETLYAEMSNRLQREIRPILREPIQPGSIEQRVAALVERRIRVFEHTLPYFRSAETLKQRSEFLREDYTHTRQLMRDDINRQLAPEIDQVGELAEALDMLLAPEAYQRLRVEQRLGKDRLARLLERAVLVLLASARDD